MRTCTDVRDLFSAVLEGEAADTDVERVMSHIASCTDCAELYDAIQLSMDAGHLLAEVEPPAHIADEIASSPCRRWLGLLYQAVDRDISQHNLDRLLGHLDRCPTCRQTWLDLTLIHQVGDAMTPPGHLESACIQVRNAVARIAVLPRRTATAAAYVLALLASVAIGNPAIIAQDMQAAAAERVAQAATEVSAVAEGGRGEMRVALWRAMRWSEHKIDTVRGWIDSLRDNDDDTAGDNAIEPAEPRQGDDA